MKDLLESLDILAGLQETDGKYNSEVADIQRRSSQMGPGAFAQFCLTRASKITKQDKLLNFIAALRDQKFDNIAASIERSKGMPVNQGIKTPTPPPLPPPPIAPKVSVPKPVPQVKLGSVRDIVNRITSLAKNIMRDVDDRIADINLVLKQNSHFVTTGQDLYNVFTILNTSFKDKNDVRDSIKGTMKSIPKDMEDKFIELFMKNEPMSSNGMQDAKNWIKTFEGK